MWMEYKCAKTANMEPDPVSKFTKTNIDSVSLEATLEPGPVEVGLGWVDLPFRPEFFGMGLLSCLKQIRYSLHSPPLQSLSSSVICFPHPCRVCPLSQWRRGDRRLNSPSCFPPCGFSVLYLQAVISPLDYLVTLKAFLCVDNCLNGIPTRTWCSKLLFHHIAWK